MKKILITAGILFLMISCNFISLLNPERNNSISTQVSEQLTVSPILLYTETMVPPVELLRILLPRPKQHLQRLQLLSPRHYPRMIPAAGWEIRPGKKSSKNPTIILLEAKMNISGSFTKMVRSL